MRVLWFCVSPVQSGLREVGCESKFNGGGWIDSLLVAMAETIPELELCVCFLVDGMSTKIIRSTKYNSVSYALLESSSVYHNRFDKRMSEDFDRIYQEFTPDFIHVFGTETECTNRIIKKYGADRVLISLTGLISYYVFHFWGGIQSELKRCWTLRDLLKGTMTKAYQEYLDFSDIEKETLQLSQYVTGRTEWDYSCVKLINPKVNYFFCNENIRPAFYQKQWSYEACEKHSIFSSSSASPMKGFHQLLKALPFLLNEYPDVKVYVTGNDCRRSGVFSQDIRQTGYQKYLRRLIKKLHLDDIVEFVGHLNEEEMARRCSTSNVYVLTSNIENSPNSLGEAMLMGVPCVATGVGGVPDLLEHKKDGFLVPFDEPYILASRIKQIFDDKELAIQISNQSRKKARIRHDWTSNAMTMMEIYRHVAGKKKGK